MKIMKINGLDFTFSKKFLTTWEGLIKVSDDGRFNGLIVDWNIPEDTDIFQLNSKNKTNVIKGSLKGKSLDFAILKDEKSIYEYKLVKMDNSYYGENFITNFKVYKKNVDLEAIRPFLYSKVTIIDEKEPSIVFDDEVERALTSKDPIIYILNDLMDKYEASTVSDAFHKKAMVKVRECTKNKKDCNF